MNKKQVGAFLKVIAKDTLRPVLTNATISRYNDRLVLVGTDGHKFAAIYIEDAEELEGKLIPREALEVWYKLATGKSRLTGQEIVDKLSKDAIDGQFPGWQKLIPKGEPVAQSTMRFNAEFFKIMQELTGKTDMTVELYGEVHPMVIKSEDGVFVVMPMKKV